MGEVANSALFSTRALDPEAPPLVPQQAWQTERQLRSLVWRSLPRRQRIRRLTKLA